MSSCGRGCMQVYSHSTRPRATDCNCEESEDMSGSAVMSSPRQPRGSSNQSDEQTDKGPSRTPRKGQGKKPTSPPSYEEEREVAKPSFNFFDFREGSDDIFVESPDTLVKKMRQQAKDRMSQVQLLPEAAVYVPDDESVETIGRSYTFSGEEERSFVPLKKRGDKSSDREGASSKSPSSSTPSVFSDQSISPDLSIKEVLARDAKVAELERQIEKLKASRWKTPSIPDTINRILLGQPCCLEWYKQMDEKTALLDAAIATWDGNCITTVLLFIRKTLEFNCLLEILLRRPVAVQHYCSFLKQLQAWKELSTIYRVVGDYESLAYMRLQQCEEESNPKDRVNSLRSCHVMFKSTPALQPDAQYVDEYAKLIDRQKTIEETAAYGHRTSTLMFQPLTTTLLYCLRHRANAPESNPSSPENLRKTFNISDKQFFQMALFAICIKNNWNGLDTLITTKGVFGLGKKKKSPIGFERVVRTLASKRYRAPDDVLTRYLQEVEDLEVRLQLATEAEMFDIGIDVLRQLKDHERMSGYINQIPPVPMARHREYREKIESLLRNSQIKWK